MQKTVYLDDMEDGEVTADAGTIPFSLEGTDYVIDLSTKNATKLRSVLGPYIAAARIAGKRSTAAKTSKSGGSSPLASGYNSDQLTAIRTWANNNGHKVSSRGRVPADIIEAFEKAGGLSGAKDAKDAPPAAATAAAKKPEFSTAAK